LTDSSPKASVTDDILFLGRAIERLSVLIAEQSEEVFGNMGIVIPVRSCSLIQVLAELKMATASDLARELGQSHQLIMQKIPKLLRLGLIAFQPDKDDARKKIYYLTADGAEQLAKFEQCGAEIRRAYEHLFAEVGDVHAVVARTTNALNNKAIGQRIKSVR
tara:strand:+ start:1955 stop:2440 length:486 start_codon:yes stop_codon:yes gene_type:complete